MSYVFDSIDFKNYLLESSITFRVEGLCVWVNKIPIPVDLFDQMFNDSSRYFKVYLDHVMGAVLLGSAIHHKVIIGFSLVDFPSGAIVDKNKNLLLNVLKKELKDNFQVYDNFVSDISDDLGIRGYQIQEVSLIDALSHQGKKYMRIYCPIEIKDRIKESFPEVMKGFSLSNGDMFGNVIADDLGVYRSGFNDALAVLL
jgi:hypothetical protein